MKSFFIEALDTLFFRDGRPFEVGGEANLQIPPSPSTFYGAFRSALIAGEPGGLKAFRDGQHEALKNWVGEFGDSEGITARLRIKGPVFAEKHSSAVVRYFPLPRDVLIYVKKDSQNKKRYFLVPLQLKQRTEFISTNSKLPYFLISPYSESMEYQNWFVREDLFFKYLDGSLMQAYEFTPGEEIVLPEHIFASDYREGIGLKSKQKNVEEGKLFTQQHMVLRHDSEKQMGFVVQCEIPESFSNGGMLRLGGDGKMALLQPKSVQEAPTESIIRLIEKTNRFKVYLATPALFEMGARARAMYNGYFDSIPDLKFELIAAAVGRAEMYGGYDIVANVPKVSFPAVPAGSVFYFHLKEGNAKKILEAFHEQCISDFRHNQGFGYAFVGGITNV